MLDIPPLRITPYPLQGDGVVGYSIPVPLGKGPGARIQQLKLDWNPDVQTQAPSQLFPDHTGPFGQLWLYKGKLFKVEGGEFRDRNEIELRIKHAALLQDKELERVQREVQAFENLPAVSAAKRDRIPDDVRLFVWQRDEGKCVRCGSNERLEFDHIIPVAEGGSSTSRNVQLLCERCNRSKGIRI